MPTFHSSIHWVHLVVMARPRGHRQRQNSGGAVEVTGAQFGEFSPAQPAPDVGFDEQLHRVGGQCLIELVELLGGDYHPGFPGDRRRLDPAHWMQMDHVVERGGEYRSKNCLAVPDYMRRDALVLQMLDPR